MPAKSKQQQKFMGMVHALNKGDIKPSDVSKSVRDVAKTIKKSDAEDFASTKHSGLPKKVKEQILKALKEYANKMSGNKLGGSGSYGYAPQKGLRDDDGYDDEGPKDEGFASDAQRRAAFASGYKAKGKKGKKESVNEGYGNWVKAKNLTDIIKLSKQKKNATFYVTDDNNSRIGSFYLKNGKFAKATTANPNYDFQRNKTNLKDRSDVIYKYKVDESLNEAFVVAYGKGPKPIKPAFAAYADKKMAQKFMSDLKKDGYKVMMTQKKIKGIDEGKKRFRQQDGIGKSKYTISYHDGKQKHKDGSDFFGIKIFKNKKDLESFRKDLKKQGYIEESVNEGMFKTIDQIRQDSKDARDFIKNVFSDPDFKDMKNDREFLKYLKSIYEGFSSDAQRRAAFASGYKAKGKKGKKESIEEYDVENYQDVKEFVEFMKEYKSDVNEAEYQGRDVKLGKIMQGDVKKFKVYVKNPKGNVVKVNFGHGGSSAKGKTMKIKKSNPERRKAFRARHNCDNPGPRHKARYWACRTW